MKYKGVSLKRINGRLEWVCRYKGDVTKHEDERAAAKNYDFRLIKEGKDPVNILKPKK